MKTKLSIILLFFSFLGTGAAQQACDNLGYGNAIWLDKLDSVSFSPPSIDPPDLPLNNNNDYDRLIFWVHGLGGDSDSWGRVAPAVQNNIVPSFQARKVTSLKPEYSQFDLYGAASELGTDIRSMGNSIMQPGQEHENNFIIAHSQGGIVSRALDKLIEDDNLQRTFGGMVTFGSSHKGAKIINNKEMLYAFATEACESLLAGPIVETVEQSFILDLLPLSLVMEFVGDACNIVGGDLLPLIAQRFTNPIAEDYAVGSPLLEDLNQFESTTPLVCFYGVEEDPVLWRILYYLGIDPPNSFDEFGANDDNALVDQVAQKQQEYIDKKDYWAFVTDYYEAMHNSMCSLFSFPPGLTCLAWYINHDQEYWEAVAIKNAWQKGVEWWNYANGKYKVIIGAVDYVPGEPIEVCNCLSGPYPEPYQGPCHNTAWTDCEIEYVIPQVRKELENDGVVLAESAGGLPYAINARMINTNHQQMVNSTETMIQLNKLFNGEYGNYFRTGLR